QRAPGRPPRKLERVWPISAGISSPVNKRGIVITPDAWTYRRKARVMPETRDRRIADVQFLPDLYDSAKHNALTIRKLAGSCGVFNRVAPRSCREMPLA